MNNNQSSAPANNPNNLMANNEERKKGVMNTMVNSNNTSQQNTMVNANNTSQQKTMVNANNTSQQKTMVNDNNTSQQNTMVNANNTSQQNTMMNANNTSQQSMEKVKQIEFDDKTSGVNLLKSGTEKMDESMEDVNTTNTSLSDDDRVSKIEEVVNTIKEKLENNEVISRDDNKTKKVVKPKRLRSAVVSSKRGNDELYKYMKGKASMKSQRMKMTSIVKKFKNIIPKFNEFYKGLAKKQFDALKYYKGAGSRFMNEYLLSEALENRVVMYPFMDYLSRDEIIKPINIFELGDEITEKVNRRLKMVDILDSIFEEAKCPKISDNSLVLYRGMAQNKLTENLKAGDTYTFSTFISTSLNRRVAEMYSDGVYHDKGAIFVFSNMRNLPYVYMTNMVNITDHTTKNVLAKETVVSSLYEYVLPRGLTFKIIKVEDKSLTNVKWSLKVSNLVKLENNNLEEKIYSKIKVYYCKFISRKKPEPVKPFKFTYDTNIKLNAEALGYIKHTTCNKNIPYED